MEGLDEPPFDSDFGQKIYKNVSKKAWAAWVEHQKMLLNEYRLQPWTREAQEFLVEQMNAYFFGDGGSLPKEYVAPTPLAKTAQNRADSCTLRTARYPAAARLGDVQTIVGTWLSLVERTLGVGEVASSNLVVPTIFIKALLTSSRRAFSM